MNYDEIEHLVAQPFYSIENKNLLLHAYQEVFHNALCKTCTSSFITAYQQLKAYVKNQPMAKKQTSKSKPSGGYRFKTEFQNVEIHLAGVGVITSHNLTDEIVEEHLAKHRLFGSWIEREPTDVEG